MITRNELLTTIANYEIECDRQQRKISMYGLAKKLGITAQTIRNVCNGYYKNGKPYTPIPSPSRCINNEDFELIKELF